MDHLVEARQLHPVGRDNLRGCWRYGSLPLPLQNQASPECVHLALGPSQAFAQEIQACVSEPDLEEAKLP